MTNRNLLRSLLFRSPGIVALMLSIDAPLISAQDSVIRRDRSSVLLRPPVSAAARQPVQRPAVSRPAAELPTIVAQPRKPSAFALAKQLARVDSSATPQAAATSLASMLYGADARLNTLTLLSPNTASIWVSDSAVKERAPPGLDVAEGVVLPFRYLRVDEQTGEAMALKPWFDDGGGLRYDSRRRAYVATLRIGLRDTLSVATSRRAISPPIHLSIGAAADSVAPERLEIVETNVFTTQSRLLSTRVNGPMRVTVWPDFAPDGVELWIPLVPDYVQVRVDRPSIAGFGLSVANVTVSLSPGALAPNDSLAVTLASTGGSFDGGPIVWPKGDAPATATLRSEGVGTKTITATAEPFVEGTAAISFAFPRGLFGGAMLGALVGSALAVMRERKRVLRKSLNIFFASGVLTGIVVALIVAVGVVRIPGFALAAGGTALVSLLAGVLGGYVGPKGLESLFAPFRSGRAAPPKAT